MYQQSSPHCIPNNAHPSAQQMLLPLAMPGASGSEAEQIETRPYQTINSMEGNLCRNFTLPIKYKYITGIQCFTQYIQYLLL